MGRFLIGTIAILIVISLISIFTFNQGNKISSAAVINARATSGTTGLSITIDNDGPAITITKPENKTYEQNTSIQLLVNTTDTNNVSTAYYNINNGANSTLTLDNTGLNDSNISAAMGSNILRIFANDTLNNLNSANLTFSVNASLPCNVNWSKFDYEGSTNLTLNDFDCTALGSLSNLTLTVPDFGTLGFGGVTNLTDDNETDHPINLNLHIVFTNNFISINSTAVPNLNKSTNITFYNITFSNPKILRDGADCPASICEIISYSNNRLKFSVTHFSSYEGAGGGGGGSGGSGGGSAGGGGGGGGGTALVRKIIGLIEKIKDVEIGVNERVIFTIFIDGRPKDYSLTLLKINRVDQYVDIKLDTLGMITALKINEEKRFDLNNDDRPDILVKLLRINVNKVVLLIGILREEEPLELEEDERKRPQREEPFPFTRGVAQFFRPEREQRNAISLIVFMFLVMSVIVAWEYFHNKKSRFRIKLK
ncbi:MAG: hypothetical protein AABY07_06810 [Nanoarchaeota archaeon]